jgi:transposase-like protein
LDYLKIVHVHIRRPHSSSQALYKTRQTHWRDHSAVWIPDEERAQELASRIRTEPRFAGGLCAFKATKYSDEQKEVAVQHYLNHDRCLAGTLKALGYPCPDALAAWLNELHPETRKRVVGKARSVTRPAELKQAAVIELCTRQTSAQAIEQKLAVSRPTLYKWKNQLLGPEVPATMKFNDDSPPDPERTELERQVESLRRDVRQLQLEHDILKKANELLKKGPGRRPAVPEQSGEDNAG